MSEQNNLEKNASEEEPGQGETTEEAGASRKDGGKDSERKDSGSSGD